MLYYVFSGPLSLRAYVPEIKFNNNNNEMKYIIMKNKFNINFNRLSKLVILYYKVKISKLS